jgi:hypothetical protein
MAGNKQWWDCFARGAGRAFWLEAYMRHVDYLEDEESPTEIYNPEAHAALSPGGGEDWDDYAPPTPKRAFQQGYIFAKAVKAIIPDGIWFEMDKWLGCERAGFYTAMPAMGHGISFADEGIDDSWIDMHEEPWPSVADAAYDAVRKAVKELGY